MSGREMDEAQYENKQVRTYLHDDVRVDGGMELVEDHLTPLRRALDEVRAKMEVSLVIEMQLRAKWLEMPVDPTRETYYRLDAAWNAYNDAKREREEYCDTYLALYRDALRWKGVE